MNNKGSRFFRFVFYFVCLNMIFPISASAYIDPATTSYVVQIVAGIIIAAGTAIGIFWNKIKRKFKKTESTPEIQKDNVHKGTITAEDLLSDTDDDK